MIPRRLHPQMSTTLSTSDGRAFRGEFGSPNGFPRPRKELQNLPHRSLFVPRGSLASDGMIVSARAQFFLLCGQHHLDRGQLFLAVEARGVGAWERLGSSIDPVTKLARSSSWTTLKHEVRFVQDTLRFEDEQSFERPVYRVITGEPVEAGDRLDGLEITQVTRLGEVWIGEAR